MKMNDTKREAVNADLRKIYGTTITRQEILEHKKKTGDYAVWIRRDASLRVGRGEYRIPGADYVPGVNVGRGSVSRRAKAEPTSKLQPLASAPVVSAPVVTKPVANIAASFDSTLLNDRDALSARIAALATEASALSVVPERDSTFVPFGDYDMIEQVIRSGKFFPVFITGLSGNGKTMGVEQACARTGREYVRANITLETDEDDLLGGFRLKDGNTVFEMGPVIIAMLRGAVILFDEIDLASAKVMCLQPVLEGKPITLKKLGITVHPAPGFTAFATANTKGRGDETGKFIGAGLLNEAFLERFPITVEQEYPSVAVEKKILAKNIEKMGFEVTAHAATFIDTLARWAEAIRVTFTEGGIEDLVSTRRLVHIMRAYCIFNGDDAKALAYCVNRFDPKVKTAFCDLYNKLAPDAAAPTNVGSLDGDARVSMPDAF